MGGSTQIHGHCRKQQFAVGFPLLVRVSNNELIVVRLRRYERLPAKIIWQPPVAESHSGAGKGTQREAASLSSTA